jgi:hypothetical protein
MPGTPLDAKPAVAQARRLRDMLVAVATAVAATVAPSACLAQTPTAEPHAPATSAPATPAPDATPTVDAPAVPARDVDSKRAAPAVPSDGSPTPVGAPLPKASQPKAPAKADEGRRAASRLGLDLSGKRDLQLTGDTTTVVELADGRQGIRMEGNVRLVQGTLTVTADALEGVYREGGAGGFERIEGTGRFELRQGDLELRCEHVVYDADACTVHCESSEPCGSDTWPARPARLVRGDGQQIESRVLDYNLCTAQLVASCGVRSVFKGRSAEPDAETESQ